MTALQWGMNTLRNPKCFSRCSENNESLEQPHRRCGRIPVTGGFQDVIGHVSSFFPREVGPGNILRTLPTFSQSAHNLCCCMGLLVSNFPLCWTSCGSSQPISPVCFNGIKPTWCIILLVLYHLQTGWGARSCMLRVINEDVKQHWPPGAHHQGLAPAGLCHRSQPPCLAVWPHLSPLHLSVIYLIYTVSVCLWVCFGRQTH